MKSMQRKILDRLEQMTENAGLDPVEKTTFSNTGTVYAMDEDFRTVAAFSYSFQDTYCRVQFGATEEERNKDTRTGYQNYDDHAALTAIFSRWSTELVRARIGDAKASR